MKVSLVVASGVHQGKVIAITGPRFLIGRDPECQLRPASQAVSKKHCAILIRDGKVFVEDFGSTNGTLINEVPVPLGERLVTTNDLLKVGPLDFHIRIEPTPAPSDPTPVPEVKPQLKAVAPGVKSDVPVKSGSKSHTPVPKSPSPVPEVAIPADEEHDRIAAMLLGLADDPDEVPGGNTVTDMPVVSGAEANPGAGTAAAKAADKPKKAQSREDMSNTANDILRQYRNRPK